MYIIAVASLKGGVGKTTHSTNLSVHLSMKGKRVLAVDLDLNNNLTDFFLRSLDRNYLEERNVLSVILGEKEIEDCVHKTGFSGLEVLPATISLGAKTKNLETDFLLSTLGSSLKRLDYDYIVLDTPGHLSVELQFAVTISDLILSPVCPKRWVFQGMKDLKDVEEGFEKESLRIVAVPSMVGKGKQEEERLFNLKKKYPVTRTSIGKLRAIEKASEEGKALKVGSKGYLWFESLADEILQIQKRSVTSKQRMFV
ncbi:ParA family protein [Leptospira fletcheri]|uniref:ParA family protein n=1 Tax=Leptospira fletcheri TaxID=2484981 RepID=A0A4R9G479_9LEPT|nr:ParA family protein [Leptospira fletcheri]TGK06316.1 ParA family protein [Leptospira fletcheri]